MTTLIPIAVFDIAGPIVVQGVMTAHGTSQTVALAVAGVPPAFSVVAGAAWRRRVDAIGAFVLSSIVLATLLGLAQAGISAAIIEATSTHQAFLINKILPYIALGLLGVWTAVYGVRAKRRGEAMAAARPAQARGMPAPG